LGGSNDDLRREKRKGERSAGGVEVEFEEDEEKSTNSVGLGRSGDSGSGGSSRSSSSSVDSSELSLAGLIKKRKRKGEINSQLVIVDAVVSSRKSGGRTCMQFWNPSQLLDPDPYMAAAAVVWAG